ncbi:MAG: hypothetical protein COB04_05610 [Gammaproteobacteria bacterium]|nr:MAG: hypothetical protein COB04_05610 [Gammaproteobacteria bacterium]
MSEKVSSPVDVRDIVQKKQVLTLFQPIVSVKDSSVYGFEALARGPEHSPFYGAEDLFSRAADQGYLEAMNELTSQLAIERFKQQSLDSKLFINFSPQSITQTPSGLLGLVRYMEEQRLSPDRVVVEITEHYPVKDYQQLRTVIDQCRDLGVKIAIDDLGAGYSGLRLWSEIAPDYVKLDQHFVQELRREPEKRIFIDMIQGLAAKLDCQIIAEGVESESDYEIVVDMGVPLVQGFHLGRPLKNPSQFRFNVGVKEALQ